MKESYINRASKFLKYRDLQSSSRIYKEISNFNYKKSFLSIIRQNRFLRSTYKKLRKSNFYFPLMRVFYQLVKTFVPIDKKLIVFESGVGKQYSDSPRAIYEELVQRKADYKFVWICNKKIRFANKKTIRINRLGPRYFYYLARARFWVNNQNFPTYLTKRKGTTYIQTWHGTPLKKMLFDIENVQGRTSDYVERIYKATKTWDYLVSPSPYATNSFKSAFRYSGKMLEVGYPRNDIFYQEKRFAIAKNVKRNLKIPSDKKVILYAPTFRDNQTVGTNKFVFDLKFDLHQMKEKLGDDYVLLLRMHVAISNKLNVPSEFDDFVYNVSDYSDIQELFLMTDVLITDYSSVFFDFANSKKPILFFTYDLEEYRDETRGFYMNLEEESPGPLLRTNEEVIDNLLNIGEMENDYKDRYVRFYEKYCGLEDGQASKRVVDLITNMK
jgi:CDP-glycerol glycerophosphotransferase